MFINAWRPQQSAVREQGGADSGYAAGWLILSNPDALIRTFVLVHTLVRAHTCKSIHTHYSVTRRHVFVVRGGRALPGWREGVLVKAHQGRSVSTGGRVVQEHRGAPAAVRRSWQAEGAGTELQPLNDTGETETRREETPIRQKWSPRCITVDRRRIKLCVLTVAETPKIT